MFPDFLYKASVFKRIGLFLIAPLFFPFMIVSCANEIPVARVTEIVHIQITATPHPPTATAVPTQTPTITPTPTPTAPAIQITGDPYSQVFSDPTPAPGAYCGFVDTFDFPLNPPDGDGIRGGEDFGIYRSRYGKYHAGEDWGFRGGSAFGDPVYAIGHGTVTFADGLGWGPDKGVVIIRHYFPDGSTVLSFYGHLDPPSVTLVPGTCIRRGELVGAIGRPRTSPHLHLEIRTTMPFVAGPGYWESDPTTAGWLPPSAYIAQQRIERMRGTRWVRTDIDATQILGLIDPETLVVREGSRLLGLYAPAGGIRWVHELRTNPADVILSESSGEIYVRYLNGALEALRLPFDRGELPGGAALVSRWETESSVPYQTELIAAPWGGVVLLSQGMISALDAEGEMIWAEDMDGPVVGWVEHNGMLAISSAGGEHGLQLFGPEGPLWNQAQAIGLPYSSADGIYMLSRDKLTLVIEPDQSPLLILKLTEGLRPGQLVQTPNGGALLLHADPSDERLILIRDGEMIWDRSVVDQISPGGRLISAGEDIYLLTQSTHANAETIELFRIDIDARRLERVFIGGTRASAPSRLAFEVLGSGEIVIRFGENSLVLFDQGLMP